MDIEESGLHFSFRTDDVIKFDATPFYRESFNNLPGGKGVDFISDSENGLVFLEVKNCTGKEADNRWRVACNDRKLREPEIKAGKHSLDVEVALKTAMTLACLAGAATKSAVSTKANDLKPYALAVENSKVIKSEKPLLVILFLEGNFSSSARSKKTVMHELQESLRRKLVWLNCRVSVVDSDTYNSKFFCVSTV